MIHLLCTGGLKVCSPAANTLGHQLMHLGDFSQWRLKSIPSLFLMLPPPRRFRASLALCSSSTIPHDILDISLIISFPASLSLPHCPSKNHGMKQGPGYNWLVAGHCGEAPQILTPFPSGLPWPAGQGKFADHRGQDNEVVDTAGVTVSVLKRKCVFSQSANLGKGRCGGTRYFGTGMAERGWILPMQ